MVCSRRSCPITISLDGLWLRHRAALPPQVVHQPRYRIWTSEVLQREQVVLGPNGIPNFEETPRAETRDGVILRHPVRTAVDPSVVSYQVAVISQCEGRQPEATCRAQLVRPPAQDPLELVVDEGELYELTTAVSLQHRLHHCSLRGRVLSVFRGILVSVHWA